MAPRMQTARFASVCTVQPRSRLRYPSSTYFSIWHEWLLASSSVAGNTLFHFASTTDLRLIRLLFPKQC
jgi:hypothetical protein